MIGKLLLDVHVFWEMLKTENELRKLVTFHLKVNL